MIYWPFNCPRHFLATCGRGEGGGRSQKFSAKHSRWALLSECRRHSFISAKPHFLLQAARLRALLWDERPYLSACTQGGCLCHSIQGRRPACMFSYASCHKYTPLRIIIIINIHTFLLNILKKALKSFHMLNLLGSTSVADHSWSIGIAFGTAIESHRLSSYSLNDRGLSFVSA